MSDRHEELPANQQEDESLQPGGRKKQKDETGDRSPASLEQDYEYKKQISSPVWEHLIIKLCCSMRRS